ncbi:PREDICTED: 3-isopropylmalate dehydratase small subunit 1 [Camelina sativa]|uniref:3-isopropylmalate dehydratase small subunit 1 n=1 Tax=Camelina sativa TaxID=90675 RepID=A0ABM0ZMJ9_CAMSA|nr:PREDICTED: 3-isopropylmalate dehydratase small subunit 1 [Camelina sativa]
MASSSLATLPQVLPSSSIKRSSSLAPFQSSSFLKINGSTSFIPSSISLTSRGTSSTTIIPRAAAAGSDSNEAIANTTFHGLCYVLKDNIDTDQIIPAGAACTFPTNQQERDEIAGHALSGLPDFHKTRYVEPGENRSKYSIIIGGENFGCGSSREHAPVCLGAAGAKAIVAQSYARIFFRNSVATGEVFPLESEVRVCDECKTGDTVTIELTETGGLLTNHTTGKNYNLKSIGDAGPVIDAGGIFSYARMMGMIPSLT